MFWQTVELVEHTNKAVEFDLFNWVGQSRWRVKCVQHVSISRRDGSFRQWHFIRIQLISFKTWLGQIVGRNGEDENSCSGVGREVKEDENIEGKGMPISSQFWQHPTIWPTRQWNYFRLIQNCVRMVRKLRNFILKFWIALFLWKKWFSKIDLNCNKAPRDLQHFPSK
jgi:hypothetical protein